MNILNIHESTAIHGGAEVYINQLHNLLKDAGHRSYWLGIEMADEIFKLSNADNDQILQTNKSRLLQYLENFLQTENIDIINIHTIFETDIVKLLLQNKPVVKFSHSPVMVCPGRDKFWRYSERICNIKFGLHCFYHIYSEGCSSRHPQRIAKAWKSVKFEVEAASRLYSKIVVMSDYIKSGLLECNISEEKILVNPYFTDYESNISSVEGKERRILFIGRIISSKGPHILIDSLKETLKSRDEVFLDIVGDGLLLDDLKNQVEKEGIKSKVVFHGWKGREEVKKLLKRSYLLAFPSIYPEAFGITGIEAMMNAKPVVGFDVGGVSTWLKDEETGFLIPSGNLELFRDKIELLINDSVLYKTISNQARIMAVNKFVPEIHFKNLMDLYKEILLN